MVLPHTYVAKRHSVHELEKTMDNMLKVRNERMLSKLNWNKTRCLQSIAKKQDMLAKEQFMSLIDKHWTDTVEDRIEPESHQEVLHPANHIECEDKHMRKQRYPRVSVESGEGPAEKKNSISHKQKANTVVLNKIKHKAKIQREQISNWYHPPEEMLSKQSKGVKEDVRFCDPKVVDISVIKNSINQFYKLFPTTNSTDVFQISKRHSHKSLDVASILSCFILPMIQNTNSTKSDVLDSADEAQKMPDKPSYSYKKCNKECKEELRDTLKLPKLAKKKVKRNIKPLVDDEMKRFCHLDWMLSRCSNHWWRKIPNSLETVEICAKKKNTDTGEIDKYETVKNRSQESFIIGCSQNLSNVDTHESTSYSLYVPSDYSNDANYVSNIDFIECKENMNTIKQYDSHKKSLNFGETTYKDMNSRNTSLDESVSKTSKSERKSSKDDIEYDEEALKEIELDVRNTIQVKNSKMYQGCYVCNAQYHSSYRKSALPQNPAKEAAPSTYITIPSANVCAPNSEMSESLPNKLTAKYLSTPESKHSGIARKSYRPKKKKKIKDNEFAKSASKEKIKLLQNFLQSRVWKPCEWAAERSLKEMLFYYEMAKDRLANDSTASNVTSCLNEVEKKLFSCIKGAKTPLDMSQVAYATTALNTKYLRLPKTVVEALERTLERADVQLLSHNHTRNDYMCLKDIWGSLVDY